MPDVLLPSGKSFSVFLWDRASMTVISVSTLSLCKRKTKFLKKVQRSLSCKINLKLLNFYLSLTSTISIGFSFSVT